jgi:hypothetical protein
MDNMMGYRYKYKYHEAMAEMMRCFLATERKSGAFDFGAPLLAFRKS